MKIPVIGGQTKSEGCGHFTPVLGDQPDCFFHFDIELIYDRLGWSYKKIDDLENSEKYFIKANKGKKHTKI